MGEGGRGMEGREGERERVGKGGMEREGGTERERKGGRERGVGDGERGM